MKNFLCLLPLIVLLVWCGWLFKPTNSLTGTWQGIADDASGLFVANSDQPQWPVTVKLQRQDHGKFIGTVHSSELDALNGKIWGQYRHGVLSQVFFLTDKFARLPSSQWCGDVSSPTKMTGNRMVLRLHWENAMTGADFVLHLKKISAEGLAKKNWFKLRRLMTCH